MATLSDLIRDDVMSGLRDLGVAALQVLDDRIAAAIGQMPGDLDVDASADNAEVVEVVDKAEVGAEAGEVGEVDGAGGATETGEAGEVRGEAAAGEVDDVTADVKDTESVRLEIEDESNAFSSGGPIGVDKEGDEGEDGVRGAARGRRGDALGGVGVAVPIAFTEGVAPTEPLLVETESVPVRAAGRPARGEDGNSDEYVLKIPRKRTASRAESGV